MEDDDEFGDLYTDVLKPLQSSAPQPHQSSPAPAPISRPIDLYDPSSIQRDSSILIDPNQTQVANSAEFEKNEQNSARDSDFFDKDVKFDIEEDMGNDAGIPGLSDGGELGVSGRDGGGEGWESESDSEDDLKIVLNDDSYGRMGMERGGMGIGDGDDDDDDEDGDPLVILGDNEPRQGNEEQEWGCDAVQGGDGERKEGEAAKGSAGLGVTQKMGYGAHGFHPFSQFKYVRPAAAPIPASTAVGSGGPTGQVRPLVNIGPFAGRGRGDWRATGMRPPMQKGFNPGYGMPVWGAGRGFSGGLDFTLPSHKTIFEVDIDSFEEKPWKHPGVDISEFFNFGLNEETWKEYCKHLEQQRLESTMQSRIRVIDSGRADQEYDPDMPPELAAATGVLEIPAENLGRSDVGHNEQARASARPRPQIPTGRAIQVECGYGERLPSIDTRPPRIRDSDAVIEIICQDNLDDNSSTGNDESECPENYLDRDNISGGCLPEEDLPIQNKVSDGFQQGYHAKQRELSSKNQSMNSVRNDMTNEGRLSSSPFEALDHNDLASMDKSQSCSGKKLRPSEGRPITRRRRERSPQSPSSQGTCDYQNEEPSERMNDEHIIVSSSPVNSLSEQESSADHKAVADDETLADCEEFDTENEETLDARATKVNAGNTTGSQRKHRTSQTGKQAPEESDGQDSKAASSENSKARSGSSREYQNWRDNIEEEVVRDGHKKQMGRIKRRNDEREERLQRRDHDGRLEMERSHHFDCLKERGGFDGSLQITEDDTQSGRVRNLDARKRERGEEVGLRNKCKARESERSYKEQHSSSRNQLDNGPYKVHYDKNIGLRQRERDCSMKNRHEKMDYNHSKRRKDEDYSRREYIGKEEIWHGHRESRRKRERDDIMDQQRRDEPPRIRENPDDHHSLRHIEEGFPQRERGDRRERDDWNKLRQDHDETILKQGKEEKRASMRNGRVVEDKTSAVHARMKDEYRSSDRRYQFKDPVRHSEHHRGHYGSYARHNHNNYEEKGSRHDMSIDSNNRVVEASNNSRGHGKRYKEDIRKVKEPESSTCNTSGHPRKNQDDQSVRVTETVKSNIGQSSCEREAVSSKRREDASDDDDQLETKRGRSKLERWTSHKDRNFSIKTKSTSSKFKGINVNGTGGPLNSNRVHDEFDKSVATIVKEHPSSESKGMSDLQSHDADKNPAEDKHLDTVEKLKKRSERFKRPLSSEKEKETLTVKKIETETLPSVKSEARVEPEIKQERPARKRRWTGN